MVWPEEDQKSDRAQTRALLSRARLNPSTPTSFLVPRSSFLVHLLWSLLALALLTAPLAGCNSSTNHYVLVEDSLRAGNVKRADQIVAQAEGDYGTTSRVLYRMDRGMTLHLAGQYDESNAILEQAEAEVEELYTRRARTDAKAFLVNDTLLPYEGEPYEQVMINVLKALNYAELGRLHEALVEARRIDERLNVLTDLARDKDAYRDDAFARYLTGILYEATGDLNNAFIAYRKAYDSYRQARPWARVTVPPMLRVDLLRVTEALHLTEEHQEYRDAFTEVAWQPAAQLQHLAHVVVISYNGRGPRKEDQFIDLPISLDALRLVLLTKGAIGNSTQDSRATESLVYGLSGRVVRVALPRLVPQKSQVAYEQVSLTGAGESFTGRTELMQDFSALAAKSLNDRYLQLAIKAVARAAVKYALAEGAGRGAHAAAGKDAGPLVGLLVGFFAHALAVGTEESDKRNWRTLPDEIQIARLWVPPGSYELHFRPVGLNGNLGKNLTQPVTLQSGETKFFIERVVN